MKNKILQINSLTKTYNGNGRTVHALNDVSFSINEGEIFGLLGVNGAGKTTLSSILATLHPPTSGDVLYNGVSIYHDVATYRYKVGFCPQKPNLDPALTLEQNLRFSGGYYNMTQEEINSRLEFLTHQLGLREYLHQKASILSGGYKQRFMIARALMHNPQLVILDEPTVGLDPHIRRQLWQQIKDLKQLGVTIILTTHYLDEAEQLSDRVCFLHKGKIILISSVKELKEQRKQEHLEDIFIDLVKEQQEK